LRYSARRPFHLMIAAQESSELRRWSRQGVVTVVDMVPPAVPVSGKIVSGWGGYVCDLLERDALTTLVEQLIERQEGLRLENLNALGEQLRREAPVPAKCSRRDDYGHDDQAPRQRGDRPGSSQDPDDMDTPEDDFLAMLLSGEPAGDHGESNGRAGRTRRANESDDQDQARRTRRADERDDYDHQAGRYDQAGNRRRADDYDDDQGGRYDEAGRGRRGNDHDDYGQAGRYDQAGGRGQSGRRGPSGRATHDHDAYRDTPPVPFDETASQRQPPGDDRQSPEGDRQSSAGDRQSSAGNQRQTPASKRHSPSSVMSIDSPAVLEQLEKLDDVVYNAINGDGRALDEVTRLWPQLAADLGPDKVEESREQYVRYSLSIWESFLDEGLRDPNRAVASLHVLSVLFNDK
jgi:hypothetical protein